MNEKHYELKKIMQEKLAAAQLKNPSFSLRAFAKYIDSTPSSVSEFFNNKRKFSDKKIKKILERLGMSPLEINNFEQDYSQESERTQGHEVERLKIDSDVFFLVSNPIYYTILAFIETKNFSYNNAKIAKRIGHNESEVQVAIQKLLELNLVLEVKRGPKKTLKVNTPHLDTISGVSSHALRLRHQKNLDDARNALHTLPVTERFFAFETLAVDKKKLPEVQELMFQFLDDLHKIADASTKDEVYEFCFNYFPRTVFPNTTTEKIASEVIH